MPWPAAGGGCWSGGRSRAPSCALLPMAFNPDVWQQYADAMANRPPQAKWVSPTLASLFRLAFGEKAVPFQFVPAAIGLVWFAWYRWAKRHDWNWTEQLPLVLLVSFVTAPYGAWPFDMVLLLPAVFAMMAKRPTPNPLPEGRGLSPAPSLQGGGWGVGSSLGLVAVNVGCLVMNVCQTGSFWFIWVSPAVLVLYALHMRQSPSYNAQRAAAPRAEAAVAVPV